MMETLWNVCAWTGFAWWCGVIFAGTVALCGAAVEALCVKWEEEQLRRIAADNDDLPANWQEIDSHESWLAAVAEMKRKTGGAS